MLRVMTFNVRYREADDGRNRWDRRKSRALERIRAFDPDLLGIQECSAGPQATYLRRQLARWTFTGIRTADPSWPIEMAPIFIRRRGFRVETTGHFWLSDTPAVASASWGAAFARTATWARVRHLATGRSIVFLNTHVDYEPEAARRSAHLLAEWSEQMSARLPLIVTGDFNANKRSAAYRRLTRGHLLRDVFRAPRVISARDGSFHGYGTINPPRAIDWILVSRHFTVMSADVDRYHDGNCYPSDHYPVGAVLRLNEPRQRKGVR